MRRRQRLVHSELIRIIELHCSPLTCASIRRLKVINLHIIKSGFKWRSILSYLRRQLLLHKPLYQRIVSPEFLRSEVSCVRCLLQVLLPANSIWIILRGCCLTHPLMRPLLRQLLVHTRVTTIILISVGLPN